MNKPIRYRLVLLVFGLLLGFVATGWAQTDSTKVPPKPKPKPPPKAIAAKQDTTTSWRSLLKSDSLGGHTGRKAAVRSALIPGWGQLYNKKVWKAPIIYAGLGTSVYFIAFNYSRVSDYRQAYIYKTDTDSTNDALIATSLLPYDPNTSQYLAKDFLTIKDIYRRYLDYSVIATTLIYVLNIIDASVDGHLFEFDVSDDLSLRLQPTYYYNGQDSFKGISLTLRL